jgi:hypothetical protein
VKVHSSGVPHDARVAEQIVPDGDMATDTTVHRLGHEIGLGVAWLLVAGVDRFRAAFRPFNVRHHQGPAFITRNEPVQELAMTAMAAAAMAATAAATMKTTTAVETAATATATMKTTTAVETAATVEATTEAATAVETTTESTAVKTAEPYEWPVTVVIRTIIAIGVIAVVRIVIGAAGIAVGTVRRGVWRAVIAWTNTNTDRYTRGRWRGYCTSNTSTHQQSQGDFGKAFHDRPPYLDLIPAHW